MNPDIARVIRCADFYRNRGYQPLPSRADGRSPDLDSYADFWQEPFPKLSFDTQVTSNIQLMCGVRWNLIVVDLDGIAIPAMTNIVSRHEPLPETWQTHSPSGGVHLWFAPRPDQQSCTSGRIWGLWDTAGGKDCNGGWYPHTGIEILGDKHLVTVPPSHRGDGAYRWVKGRSPREIAQPAVLPEWLDLMPRLPQRLTGAAPAIPRAVAASGEAVAVAGAAPVSLTNGKWDKVRYSREEVIKAINRSRAMIGVAKGFGVRFASELVNDAGWCACYARSNPGVPGRSGGDEHPSASFCPATGVYMEHYDRQPISLFDLGVMAGFASDWRDVCNSLGVEYRATPMP